MLDIFDSCFENNVLKIIEGWKREKLVVGFTNGCFDILHLGHISSLKETKLFCDKLVVGINSDESVKRLKGSLRPIQSIKTRALVLLELKSVDAVIIFNEDTALSIVKKIQPNIIAKEGYSIDNWPEAQYVETYGGKVICLSRIENNSTSSIESKILNNNQ